MNFYKKQAFTITEAIVCFTLMGLMFIATITNIGRNDSYDKLYWQAFNTLFQASKQASLDFLSNNDGSCNSINASTTNTCAIISDNSLYNKNCWDKYNANKDYVCDSVNIYHSAGKLKRAFPGFILPGVDCALGNANSLECSKIFCKNLTKYINTTNSDKLVSGSGSKIYNECNNFISLPNQNVTLLPNQGKFGVNFHNAYLDTNSGANEILPSFTTINGQKFYISDAVTANFIVDIDTQYMESWEIDWRKDQTIYDRESYRFVVVDLNGNTGPNSQFKNGQRFPDTVLFAINADGDVIPLGLPESSQAYLSAVTTCPNDAAMTRSIPTSLWQAKLNGWGVKSSRDGLYSQRYTPVEPLSESIKFYANAANCKKNVDACENKSASAKSRYVDKVYTYLVLQFLYKNDSHVTGAEGDESKNFHKFIKDDNHRDETVFNNCKCKSALRSDLSSDVPCSIDFIH